MPSCARSQRLPPHRLDCGSVRPRIAIGPQAWTSRSRCRVHRTRGKLGQSERHVRPSRRAGSGVSAMMSEDGMEPSPRGMAWPAVYLRLVVAGPKGSGVVRSAWNVRTGEDFPRLTAAISSEVLPCLPPLPSTFSTSSPCSWTCPSLRLFGVRWARLSSGLTRVYSRSSSAMTMGGRTPN